MSSLFSVVYNSDGVIIKVTIEGHAGIKKSGEGYEVCIALSALSQAMLSVLTEIVGIKSIKRKINDGYLSFELVGFDKLDKEKAYEYITVSRGYLLGIKSLIKEYPDYVKYKEELKNGT
ncbi:ribosomal-processing cysteine protease Prp [Brachyspira pilosicoli]|uniref:Ribosomal processing cysteine protease Prp n=1 Tax=Brachyspira pilosicoli TaxID=52584 RepID=A0A5C8EWD8_BRAPL|nr:ribosomal-processing cysteine protease Prp [Brachyspira pilosicoli]TXJ41939.1 ribosomal-processing cysteine protease Prp [Brachyspira pilosicoli]